MYLFKISFWNILLPKGEVQTITAVLGKTIKPILLIDRVIDVDVAPIVPIVPTDSKLVLRVL